MNKEEAVEVMAIFLHSENIGKAISTGRLDPERFEVIKSEEMKDAFRVTCGALYDLMDEQGLIVKP
jgi:hypothetical protein